MNARPMACVLDASVLVQLFLPEIDSDLVQRMVALRDAEPPLRLFVPGLLYAECANAFWKAQRGGRVAEPAAVESLRELLRLGLEWVPTFSLVQHALELASALDVSVYDACYLAAAAQLQAPFVTADAPLAKSSRAAGIATYTLREVDWLDHAT